MNYRSCHVPSIPKVDYIFRNCKFAGVITALLLCVTLCPSVFAQVTGGTVSGEVTDPSQAAVPGADVTVTQVGTSQTRKLTTDEQGHFKAPNLSPGNYEISVSAPGFSSAVQKVVIEVGQEIVANIELKVGEVTNTVTIEPDSAAVTTTTATLSNVVDGKTVRELPINGRDWTLLAALEPGVHTIEAQNSIAAGGVARLNRGWGTQLSIGGNRPQQNNYRLDGISINDYSGGGPGGVLASVLGVDAIQEFSVITGNAPADYGKTSGGIINAVTRAGQNQYHGSVYEFRRDSAFDARNFFDRGAVPPFKRDQFGGSVGGPLYLPIFGEGGRSWYNGKDHTFFFFDYEGLRQDLGVTSTLTVPSVAARAGRLVSPTPHTITVNPRVVPFLNLFQLPNAGEVGDFGFFSFEGQNIATENFFAGRLDHNFSANDSAHGAFMWDDSLTSGPDAANFVEVGQTSKRSMISLEWSHIFSPNLINIARIGYSRSESSGPIPLRALNPLASDPSLAYFGSQNVGTIEVSGLTGIDGGINGIGRSDHFYNSYQAYDDVVYSRNLHSFKFGLALDRILYATGATNAPNGRFVFGSLENFLTNRPTSFNASVPGASPRLYMRQTQFGAYIQDDWRVRPNLTLNLGLRYEPATVVTEKYNQFSTLVNITDRTPKLGSPYYNNNTLLNFSPRVGFAWDVFGDGKMSVRGGFGIYDTLPGTYQFALVAIAAAPFFQSGIATNLPQGSFPTGAFGLFTANDLRYSFVEQNPKRSYVEQWNLNIQRKLPANIVLLLGYVGQHGIHQPFRTNDANIVIPTVLPDGGLQWPAVRCAGANVGTRPECAKANPFVGVINSIAWLGTNTYHGLNVGAQRQHKGLRLGLSYTWSKSIDISSSSLAGSNFTNSIVGPLLQFPNVMRGLSDFDVRHNFSFNYLWEIPSPKSAEGVGKWVTNGWQLGGIFRVATGLPFSVFVGGDSLGMRNGNAFNFPNRLDTPECRNPVNPGNPNKYIKTECFVAPPPGRFGNAGRNTLIGPGIKNFDLSLFKNNRFGESYNIQARLEIFNVFNHPNFTVPLRTESQIFNVNFVRIPTAGVLSSTSTTSRQIQLAVKFIF